VSWGFDLPHAPLSLAGRLVGILGTIVKIAVLPMFGAQPHPPLRRTMLYSLSITITCGTYVNPLSRFPKNFLAAFLSRRLPLSPDERRSTSLRERGLREWHLPSNLPGSGPSDPDKCEAGTLQDEAAGNSVIKGLGLGERSVKDHHIVRLPVGSGPNGGLA
jgi:hypothetical protein